MIAWASSSSICGYNSRYGHRYGTEIKYESCCIGWEGGVGDMSWPEAGNLAGWDEEMDIVL